MYEKLVSDNKMETILTEITFLSKSTWAEVTIFKTSRTIRGDGKGVIASLSYPENECNSTSIGLLLRFDDDWKGKCKRK